MGVRPAIFGPQGWYPNDQAACRATLDGYREAFDGKPSGALAGIVPHAGWVYSGRLAAWTVFALAEATPEVVFLFGGHMPPGAGATCMPEGAFATPLGEIPVHRELAARLVERFDCRIEQPDRFEPDNTIELQLPIIKYTWPDTSLVAVQVPPDQDCLQLGAWAARAASDLSIPAVAIGSTDLTHYGANYGFHPRGAGPEAHAWSKRENDGPFIAHLLALEADQAVEHALKNHSACCPGAAASAVRFAAERGAKAGALIAHTTSHEIEPRGEARMWVGYAGIVY